MSEYEKKDIPDVETVCAKHSTRKAPLTKVIVSVIFVTLFSV